MLPMYTGKFNKQHLPSLDNQNFLTDCQNALNNTAVLYCGAYPKDRKTLEAQLKTASEQQDAKMFHELSERCRDFIRAEKRYLWWEETQKALNKKEMWSMLFRQIAHTDHQRFAALNSSWQQHQAYALHSSEALWVLAFKLLPAYANYLDCVAQELRANQRYVSPDVKKEVGAFLIQGYTFLRRTRREVACAMAARLEVASSTGDLHGDDVIRWHVHQLQEMGALSNELRLPKIGRGLTPTYFGAFHDFIADHHPVLRDELPKKVSWLANDKDYRTHLHQGRWMIIPKQFEKALPQNRFARGWQTLTGMRMDTYLEKHRDVIAGCRVQLHALDISQDEKEATQRLDALVDLRKQLFENLKKLQDLTPQPKKGFVRFFTSLSMKQIRLCQDYWRDQCETLATLFITAVEKQIRAWECQPDDQLHFTLEKAQMIAALNQEIAELSRQGFLDSLQRAHMQALAKRFEIIRERYKPEIRQINALLKEMTQGTLKGEGHLKPLQEHIKTLQKTDQVAWEAFQRQARSAMEGTLKVFLQGMKDLETALDPVDKSAIAVLARAFFWVLTLGTPADRERLVKASHTLYGNYLKRRHEKLLCSGWLVQVENVLLAQADALGNSDQKQALLLLRSQQKAGNTNGSTSVDAHYHHYITTDLKKDCRARIQSFDTQLWQHVKKCTQHPPTLDHFQVLLKKGTEARINSLADLKLQPFEKTLLGLWEKSKAPLITLDKILMLHQLEPTLDQLDETTLRALKGKLDDGLAAFHLVRANACFFSPALDRKQDPLAGIDPRSVPIFN